MLIRTAKELAPDVSELGGNQPRSPPMRTDIVNCATLITAEAWSQVNQAIDLGYNPSSIGESEVNKH